jgi:ferredoxin
VRRAAQAVFLGLFLWLLLVACRPEAVHPAPGASFRQTRGVEAFLMMDPLAGLSAALAGRTVLSGLAWTGVILALGLVLPRAFCGYVCPTGTIIDLFDRAIARRIPHRRARRRWWAAARYLLLIAALVAAAAGVSVAGFLAPIPLLTRGLVFLAGPGQVAGREDWPLASLNDVGALLAVGLLALVVGVGIFGPRFWCRCLCPSGAILSLAGRAAPMPRNVDSRCIRCGACLEACSFDAIGSDYSTRAGRCTACQTCGGACPTGAIAFADKRERPKTPAAADASAGADISRRSFLAGALTSAAAGLAAGMYFRPNQAAQAAGNHRPSAMPPVRPPGSLPEGRFGQLCVRCGQCVKVCPTGVLEPIGVEGGPWGLWTPQAVADRAGCRPDCNRCGQVCPTGAIRNLPLEEKRAARMGLAVVNTRTCLPHAGLAECLECRSVCLSAGYNAIEVVRVHAEVDANDLPVEDSGLSAPVLRAENCVGCGLCQARCRKVTVRQKSTLTEPAIRVLAGEDPASGQEREDRILRGSYLQLRRQRRSSGLIGRPADSVPYLPE